jgi:T-complex protein 1 subunit eta
MEETERSLHDAIMIVRRAKKNDAFVAGKNEIYRTVNVNEF